MARAYICVKYQSTTPLGVRRRLISLDFTKICAWVRETLTPLHANNKGADQPAHPRSLISAFVIQSLQSLIVSCPCFISQLFQISLHSPIVSGGLQHHKSCGYAPGSMKVICINNLQLLSFMPIYILHCKNTGVIPISLFLLATGTVLRKAAIDRGVRLATGRYGCRYRGVTS